MISTFNSLWNTKLTPRRLQKINNVLFWQAIKYIIDRLHLQVTLHKVKAHSDNLYTDIADQLAKEGCSNNSPLSISPTGIPSQLSHIRNYRRPLLLINLLIGILHNIGLNTTHSTVLQELITAKLVVGVIKTSTYNLPTLAQIFSKASTHVFFCHNTPESNEHLWTCPQVIIILIPIFRKHADIFKTLINTHSEKVPATYNDSIRFCRIFSLHLLLLMKHQNYIVYLSI